MHTISNKRTYHLVGSIHDENTKQISTWLRERTEEGPEDWLQILITSGGGSNVLGCGLIDLAICFQKARIQTVGLGNISSMAIPLFLMGENRVVSPRSVFYFHEVGLNFKKEEDVSVTKMASYLEGLRIQERFYLDFVESRTNGKLTAGRVKELEREETRLTASQAVEFGLAHEICGSY